MISENIHTHNSSVNLLSYNAKLKVKNSRGSLKYFYDFNRTASLVADPRNGIPVGNGVCFCAKLCVINQRFFEI